MKSQILFLFSILSVLGFTPESVDYNRLQGDGILSLYNIHLKEAITVSYRKPDGSYDLSAIKNLQHCLRCRRTHEVYPIPTDLIELVDVIQDHFGNAPIHVISAYRSPALNSELYKTGHKVAKNSFHTHGMAMDIQIPGVSTKDLRNFAYALDRGGVGYYPENGFVHVDVGPKRRW